MKLSLRVEYALRALMFLAREAGSEVVRIQAIAEKQGIPKRFLEQILNDLKAGEFVESKRGITGGYRLSQPPDEITVAAVIRHLGGGLAPVAGLARQGRGSRRGGDETQMAIGAMMNDVREAMVKMLEAVSIADLCERADQLRARSASPADYAI